MSQKEVLQDPGEVRSRAMAYLSEVNPEASLWYFQHRATLVPIFQNTPDLAPCVRLVALVTSANDLGELVETVCFIDAANWRKVTGQIGKRFNRVALYVVNGCRYTAAPCSVLFENANASVH